MKTIKIHLALFVIVLAISGLTAFPIQSEMEFMMRHITAFPAFFQDWIKSLCDNIRNTPQVMFYGTDWLAFAHIIIGLFFIPVYLNPIKYKINLQIGIVACFLVFPLAFICGPIRNIPFFHQLIDCSFGVFGSAYLYFILRKINKMEIKLNTTIMKKVKKHNQVYAMLMRIHIMVSSFTAHLIGPMVFSIGLKEEPWQLSKMDLLQFPKGTVGKAVGEFLDKNELKLIKHAEYHDVHHVLFDFSNSLKDEIALQFFLRGNGNNSLASMGTAIGAWCILPTHWKYLKYSYQRGKTCTDVSKLNLKELIYKDLAEVKKSLFNKQLK